jgi:tetratricopeptide (TPR) repeat protein
MTLPGPSAANARAIGLRAQGRLADAIAAFRDGIAQFPDVAALHQNLAQTLYESGDNAGAISEHRTALGIEESVASRLALYELLQIAGDRDGALENQRAALERRRLFSHVAPHEQRSVLCLCAPGDWQANIPVDFLFDHDTTTVHKLFLTDEHHASTDTVPPHDVIWNIIAESPAAIAYLALAQYFVRKHRKPALNAPARVVRTARPLLAQTLSGTSARVAPVEILDPEHLQCGDTSLAFPIIARPIGSHAGYGLERLETPADCASYVKRHPADRYFVSPFVDYASGDGYYRKYRIVYVDGAPYPVHLAISPDWMIHYYNAPMDEHQWMRDEEAAFLEDPRRAFEGAKFEAIVRIGTAVGLEYFGIDCGIDREGNVLVFEADAAMLVHTSDPAERYPYKHRFVPRIYRAVERMIDRRKAADT